MEQVPLVQIQIDERFFTKDPCGSGLGKKIIEHSIELIDTLGFEAFTFAKLAEKIGCTEASIYRYFENKHKLLVYHLTWYWRWLEYRLMLATTNNELPRSRAARNSFD